MSKKKPPNWGEIRARYEAHWEKPSDIAKDYNVSPNTISKRASLEGWGKNRKEKAINLVDEEHEREKLIDSIAGELILDHLLDYRNTRASGLMGLTVQDGEGFPNKLAEHFIKAGLASYLEKRKAVLKTQENKEDEETPGFNITPDV